MFKHIPLMNASIVLLPLQRSGQLAAVLGLAAVEMPDNSGSDFTARAGVEAFPQATDGSLHLQQAAE